MYIVYRCSGLFVIFIAWLFLVLPLVFLRKKYSTISHAALSSGWSLYIKSGVVLSGIFQILFSIYLRQQVQSNLYSVGLLLLTFGGLFFMFAGFLNQKKTFKLHSLLIKIYSVSTVLAITIISLYLNKYFLLVILVLVVGAMYFYFRKKYLASEVWTILFFSLWTIFLYVFIF